MRALRSGEPSKLKSDETWEMFPSGDDIMKHLTLQFEENNHITKICRTIIFPQNLYEPSLGKISFPKPKSA